MSAELSEHVPSRRHPNRAAGLWKWLLIAITVVTSAPGLVIGTAFPAVFLGILVSKLPEAFHPEWGSTLPTPLAQATSLLLGVPVWLVGRKALRSANPPTAHRLILSGLFLLLGIGVVGGFFHGLTAYAVPADGLAATEVAEDVRVRGLRSEGEGGFLGSANLYWSRDFVGNIADLDSRSLVGLPEGFDPVPGLADEPMWPYREHTVAGWSGPHPFDPSRGCAITLVEEDPYPSDPDGRTRASVNVDCAGL